MTSDGSPPMLNDFGCIADVYDQLVEWAPYDMWSELLAPLLAKHGLPPGGWVLDAACGTGLSTLPWLERGYRVVGTDASEEMLSRCRVRLAEAGYSADLLRQDLLALDPGRLFDAALCIHSGLDYILDDGDLERAFASLRRCLRDGGLLAFDKCLDEPEFYKDDYSDARELDFGRVEFHYRWDRTARLLEQRCSVTRSRSGAKVRTDAVYHLRAVSVADLVAMLGRQGFEMLERPRQFAITDPGYGVFRAV